eukprot:7806289-Karenia_brevis.AAC.1
MVVPSSPLVHVASSGAIMTPRTFSSHPLSANTRGAIFQSPPITHGAEVDHIALATSPSITQLGFSSG